MSYLVLKKEKKQIAAVKTKYCMRTISLLYYLDRKLDKLINLDIILIMREPENACPILKGEDEFITAVFETIERERLFLVVKMDGQYAVTEDVVTARLSYLRSYVAELTCGYAVVNLMDEKQLEEILPLAEPVSQELFLNRVFSMWDTFLADGKAER